MTVYALLATPIDRPGDALLGVYSTREVAQAHMDEINAGDPLGIDIGNPSIVEVTVDSAPVVLNFETAGF